MDSKDSSNSIIANHYDNKNNDSYAISKDIKDIILEIKQSNIKDKDIIATDLKYKDEISENVNIIGGNLDSLVNIEKNKKANNISFSSTVSSFGKVLNNMKSQEDSNGIRFDQMSEYLFLIKNSLATTTGTFFARLFEPITKVWNSWFFSEKTDSEKQVDRLDSIKKMLIFKYELDSKEYKEKDKHNKIIGSVLSLPIKLARIYNWNF